MNFLVFEALRLFGLVGELPPSALPCVKRARVQSVCLKSVSVDRRTIERPPEISSHSSFKLNSIHLACLIGCVAGFNNMAQSFKLIFLVDPWIAKSQGA